MPAPPKFSLSWLHLALLSITLSGLAPLVLIAGRASVYADMALVKTWFTPVLVLHVNLSVGLWFLAMLAAMLGNRMTSAKISFLLAILCMAVAPLFGGEAYTSNYIPVQHNPVFFLGLGFACASVLLVGITGACSVNPLHALTSLTLLTSLAAFAFSVMQYPPEHRGGEGFYEAVFWAGGHLLQLVYVQLGMLAWMRLAEALELKALPERVALALFGLLWLTSVLSLGIFWLGDVQDTDHITFFTRQMYWITGPVPTVAALWYCFAALRRGTDKKNVLWGCLAMSLVLFLFGGGLGLLIEGSNTTVPAHYHGSTVGITLALMGVFYASIRRIVSRWLALQPWLYGIGQIMHVTGLAVAGGHNIARKTAGSLEAAEQGAALALQVMRLGGLLAVLGGGLFVVLAMGAILSQSVAKRASAGD